MKKRKQSQKRAEELAQGVDPEFKLQCQKKKKKEISSVSQVLIYKLA
jgi:hypothetical protein